MDVTPNTQVPKNLIPIKSEHPVFKNNTKAISGLNEFINNPELNLVSIMCEKPLLLQALVEYVEKSAKFSFERIDATKTVDVEDALRKNIVLCLKSSRDVYEGELVDVHHSKDENGVLQNIEVTLRTMKATKKIALSKNLLNVINDVNIGDVVYIEPNSGIMKRIGRSETRLNEFDLEGDKHVPLLKSQVHTTREKDIYVSLYELDYAFNRYNEEITDFTRGHVDSTVADYVSRGIAQFVCTGVYIEHVASLKRADQFKLQQISQLYPHLKILVANASSDVYRDMFLYIDQVNDEHAFDIVQYFIKKPLNEEMKTAVEKAVTYGNYERVLAVLNVCSTVEELNDLLYNQQ